ncbi:MAG: T9SS type A sorting domain-containing protein [Prevotellaceae bacterium]|jgi:hypothetical protein|nr:T9SS type A sorting domain-containing protein [Prevotellaceae bacterium]
MKNRFLLLVSMAMMSVAAFAVQHGSIKGTGVPLYPQRDGAAPGVAVTGTTFDFRAVTVGQKTWAWTDLHGKNIAGNTWSSQFRFWQPAKLENNLLSRVAGTQQTYGTLGVPAINPCIITFLQEDNNNFFETADFTYDRTVQNSTDPTDVAAPVLADPTIVSQTAQLLKLTLSATENSGDFFYYIEDVVNNFTEVSFFDNVSLTLTPGVNYNFSIKAIDFSGNESAAKTVSTQAVEPTYITEGIAKIISFKLDSRSLTELKIECTCTSADLIGDAFVKIEINGTQLTTEWKPTIGAAGTHTYQIIVPASEVAGWAQDAILALNLGYIVMPIGNWGHYVVENKVITAGANEGVPILHKIGTGVDIDEPTPEPEYTCENNLFEGVQFSIGENYYAPNWTASTDYTATYANGEYNVTLPVATNQDWQAQFRILLDVPVAIDPTKTYGISMTVETNYNLPFYAKLMDTSDDAFIEIARGLLNAPSSEAKAMNVAVVGGLTQVSRILFDFAGNAANTSIKITNITLCDQMIETGVSLVKALDIKCFMNNGQLNINSKENIKSVVIYNVAGQMIKSLDTNSSELKINLENQASGIYFVKINTANGIFTQKVLK